MANKWSGHCLPEGCDIEFMKAYIAALDPNGWTVVGNMGLAQELHDQQGGRCRVLLRDFPYEGGAFRGMSPELWWEWQISRGYLDIARSTANEPPADDADFLAWTERLCRLWVENMQSGIAQPPLTIGQIAVGNIADGMVESGKWDEILKWCGLSNGGIHFGVHIYWAVHHMCDDFAGQLDKAASYNMANWSKAPHNRYHVDRYKRLTDRARTLGIAYIAFDFEECGWDDLPDISDNPDVRNLRNWYNGGAKLRGFHSGYLNLYPKMTGRDGFTYACDMLAHFVGSLDPWVETIKPFVYADFDADGWSDPWASLYGITPKLAKPLTDFMIAQKESEEPTMTPNWQHGQLTVVNTSTLYKRADATTSSNKLGTLVSGAPYMLYRDMAFAAEMDGFNWAKLASSLDAQPFYVATEYIDWRTDAAPAPAPSPDTMTMLMVQFDRNAALRIRNNQAGAGDFEALNNALVTALKAWEPGT